jgi:Uma2 family endonuclease
VSEAARQHFTFRDYVDLEEISGVRHEFLAGQVWAMAGGSPDHARIAANVMVLLGSQLRGKRCAVFDSDLRVRVKATGLGTYPDVTVVCGSLELDPDDPKRHTVVNPKVIVEVLSPSTEEYDRGEKLDHYRQIDSLEEIVLVASEERRIDVWRRDGAAWARVPSAGELVRLSSIGCELPLPDVYRDPLVG